MIRILVAGMIWARFSHTSRSRTSTVQERRELEKITW
jgi:hypothetical protein